MNDEKKFFVYFNFSIGRVEEGEASPFWLSFSVPARNYFDRRTPRYSKWELFLTLFGKRLISYQQGRRKDSNVIYADFGDKDEEIRPK